MRVVLNGEDGHLHWSEVPDPQIKEDEVLLEVQAAALNRADLLQRAGQYPPPPGWPDWFGLEAAGIIKDVGKKVEEEGKWHVGDKVCALLGSGGYAEYVSVKYDMCMPVPKNCTMAEAAAIPEAFATAYLKLFIEGHAKAGDTLLMQAGASGLASVIIPMAKAFGLRVVTTVISDPNNIKHLGADLVVDTRVQNLPSILKDEESAGRAIDIAIDCLGGSNLGECLPYVRYGCRWIVIAALAGQSTTIDLKNIYKKNIRIIGSTLRSRTPEMKAKILANLVNEVWDKVADGKIKPTVYKILPIAEAEEAHDILYRGENIGKVVLKVQ